MQDQFFTLLFVNSLSILASAYQTKMLREFNKISTSKLKASIVTRIARLGRITAHYAIADKAVSLLGLNVPIKPTGFPDFGAYLYQGFLPVVFVPLTGSHRKDVRLANRVRGTSSTPKGYTWHHHEIMGLMQLVKTDVHREFFGGRLGAAHTGGKFYYTIVKNTEYKR